MTNLKNAFWNGTIKKICFIIGVFCMLFFFLAGPLLQIEAFGVVGVTTFFGMFVFLLASFFLPNSNKKKHRYPKSAIREGSDQYLDGKDEEFSKEEREALLQESWMAQVEKYNRTRRN